MIQLLEKWMFEQSHCKMGFSVRHFGVSETEGFFRKFSGTIWAESEAFADAKVDLVINVNSIDTQKEGRDNYLKSADFFNAA